MPYKDADRQRQAKAEWASHERKVVPFGLKVAEAKAVETYHGRMEKYRSILSNLDKILAEAEKEIIFEFTRFMEAYPSVGSQNWITEENVVLRLSLWRRCMEKLKSTGKFPYWVASKVCGKKFFRQNEFMTLNESMTPIYPYHRSNLYDVGRERLNAKFARVVDESTEDFTVVIAWREKELSLTEAIEEVLVMDTVALIKSVQVENQAQELVKRGVREGWTDDRILLEFQQDPKKWEPIQYMNENPIDIFSIQMWRYGFELQKKTDTPKQEDQEIARDALNESIIADSKVKLEEAKKQSERLPTKIKVKLHVKEEDE